MKKLFISSLLMIINLNAAQASKDYNLFQDQEVAAKRNSSAFYGLLETLEAYYRALAVANDLRSVSRYFSTLGFKPEKLMSIKGKVDDQIRTLKSLKKSIELPPEQTEN